MRNIKRVCCFCLESEKKREFKILYTKCNVANTFKDGGTAIADMIIQDGIIPDNKWTKIADIKF